MKIEMKNVFNSRWFLVEWWGRQYNGNGMAVEKNEAPVNLYMLYQLYTDSRRYFFVQLAIFLIGLYSLIKLQSNVVPQNIISNFSFVSIPLTIIIILNGYLSLESLVVLIRSRMILMQFMSDLDELYDSCFNDCLLEQFILLDHEKIKKRANEVLEHANASLEGGTGNDNSNNRELPGRLKKLFANFGIYKR